MPNLRLSIMTIIIVAISFANTAFAQGFLNMTPCEQLGVTGMQFTSQQQKGKTREEQRAYVVEQAKAMPPAWPKVTYLSLIDWIYYNRDKDSFYVGNVVTKLCRQQLPRDRSYTVGARLRYCGALETQAYYIASDRNRGVSRQAALEGIRSHIDDQHLDDVTAALNIVYDNKNLGTNEVLDIIRRKCTVGPEVVFDTPTAGPPSSPAQVDRQHRNRTEP